MPQGGTGHAQAQGNTALAPAPNRPPPTLSPAPPHSPAEIVDLPAPFDLPIPIEQARHGPPAAPAFEATPLAVPTAAPVAARSQGDPYSDLPAPYDLPIPIEQAPASQTAKMNSVAQRVAPFARPPERGQRPQAAPPAAHAAAAVHAVGSAEPPAAQAEGPYGDLTDLPAPIDLPTPTGILRKTLARFLGKRTASQQRQRAMDHNLPGLPGVEARAASVPPEMKLVLQRAAANGVQDLEGLRQRMMANWRAAPQPAAARADYRPPPPKTIRILMLLGGGGVLIGLGYALAEVLKLA